MLIVSTCHSDKEAKLGLYNPGKKGISNNLATQFSPPNTSMCKCADVCLIIESEPAKQAHCCTFPEYISIV